MNCIKCSAEIPDKAIYCPFCGRKQVREKQKRKRANGEGTVYQLPSGIWVARKIWYAEGADGIKQRCSVSRSGFTSEAKARQYLPMLQTGSEARRAKKKRKAEVTLGVLISMWKSDYTRRKEAEGKGTGWKSTLGCYSAGLKIFSEYNDTPINDIEIDDLQECMSESDKGKRTRENAKTAVGLVYKYGIPRGYIERSLNLAEYLYVGAGNSYTREPFTDAELDLLRQAIGNVPYAEYVYAHCYLGFRPSAFVALDVARYDRAERYVVGGIKTEAGKDRIVTVSPKIQNIVDGAAGDRTSGPLFAAQSGEALSLKEYRQIFYDVLEAIGIDNPITIHGVHRLTPHSCRHTFITLAKRVDAPERDKMALAGHSSEASHHHYQHVNISELKRITNAL